MKAQFISLFFIFQVVATPLFAQRDAAGGGVVSLGDINVQIVQGDITRIHADAYVVPHFNGAATFGGVGGAVARAGALSGVQAFDSYIHDQGAVEFGHTHVTESGGGNSRFLLNVVSVGSGADVEFRVVAESMYNALVAAGQSGAQTVAAPALGTGIIGQLSADQSARAMLAGIQKYSHENGGKIKGIQIVIYGDRAAAQTFSDVLASKSYLKAKPGEKGQREFDLARWIQGMSSDAEANEKALSPERQEKAPAKNQGKEPPIVATEQRVADLQRALNKIVEAVTWSSPETPAWHFATGVALGVDVTANMRTGSNYDKSLTGTAAKVQDLEWHLGGFLGMAKEKAYVAMNAWLNISHGRFGVPNVPMPKEMVEAQRKEAAEYKAELDRAIADGKLKPISLSIGDGSSTAQISKGDVVQIRFNERSKGPFHNPGDVITGEVTSVDLDHRPLIDYPNGNRYTIDSVSFSESTIDVKGSKVVKPVRIAKTDEKKSIDPAQGGEGKLIWNGQELKTVGDIGKAMSAIVESESQQDADRFMEAYRRVNPKNADANVGYISGYYDRATMAKMQRMFKTAHPVFGKAGSGEEITDPKEIFAKGVEEGQRQRREANGQGRTASATKPAASSSRSPSGITANDRMTDTFPIGDNTPNMGKRVSVNFVERSSGKSTNVSGIVVREYPAGFDVITSDGKLVSVNKNFGEVGSPTYEKAEAGESRVAISRAKTIQAQGIAERAQEAVEVAKQNAERASTLPADRSADIFTELNGKKGTYLSKTPYLSDKPLKEPILLLSPERLKKLPNGTVVWSLSENRMVVGIDYLDTDTRGGVTYYGLRRSGGGDPLTEVKSAERYLSQTKRALDTATASLNESLGGASKGPRGSDADVFAGIEDRDAASTSKRVGEVLSEQDRRAEKDALAKMTPQQRAEYQSIRDAGQAVKDAIRKVLKK